MKKKEFVILILCFITIILTSCVKNPNPPNVEPTNTGLPANATPESIQSPSPIISDKPVKSDIFGLKIEENPLPSVPSIEEIKMISPDGAFGVDFVERYYSVERDDVFKPFHLMHQMGLKPGDAIADVGCGAGYFAFRFSRVVGNKGKVYAVDIDDRVLKILKRILELHREKTGEKFQNIEIIESSEDSINVPENSLDFAFLCWIGVYVYTRDYTDPPARLKDPDKAVEVIFEGTHKFTQSIYKALKKDGKLVIINERKGFHSQMDIFDEGTIKIMKKNGFLLDRRIPLMKRFYVLVFRKKQGI